MIIAQKEVKEFLQLIKNITSDSTDVYLAENFIILLSSLPMANNFIYRLDNELHQSVGWNKEDIVRLKLPTFLSLLKITDKNNVSINILQQEKTGNKVLESRSVVEFKKTEQKIKTSDFSLVKDLPTVEIHPQDLKQVLDKKDMAHYSCHAHIFVGSSVALSNINGFFLEVEYTYSTNSCSIVRNKSSSKIEKVFIPASIYKFVTGDVRQDEAHVSLKKDPNSTTDSWTNLVVKGLRYALILDHIEPDEQLVRQLKNIFEQINTEVIIQFDVPQFLAAINIQSLKDIKPKRLTLGIKNGTYSIKYKNESGVEYNGQGECNSMVENYVLTFSTDDFLNMINMCGEYSTLKFYPANDRAVMFSFGEIDYILGKIYNK